jgi:hypothetical protein
MNKIVEKISAEYAKKNGYAIDPMTILMIANFVMQLAKAIYECRKNRNKTIETMLKPNFLYRMLLSRRVTKFISDNNLSLDKASFMDAMLKTKFSQEEITLLVSEAILND